MFRAVINSLTRAIGWDLVGRWLVFADGEGPASEALRSTKCEVLEVRPGSAEFPDAILVKLEGPTVVAKRKLRYATLIPRHSGYEADALATTSISVYVFPSDATVSVSPVDWKQMVAMMDVRVSK